MFNTLDSRAASTDGFCVTAEPIHAGPRETEETRRRVDAHNAVGVESCGR